MLVRALLFLVTFALLQVGWQLLASERVRAEVVHAGVALPAAGLARLLTPELAVRADGTVLRAAAPASGAAGGIHIVNGCDGTDMLFLLCAAFAVAPLGWRWRLGGLLLGGTIVYALNQLRILALFYAQRRDPGLFDLLHGYLAPVSMLVLIVLYFQLWVRRAAALGPSV